jgi:hypothetical protein
LRHAIAVLLVALVLGVPLGLGIGRLSEGRDPTQGARAAAETMPAFGSYWHDGKAELDGYRYALTRYGQRRTGQAVAVYVTEPFSKSENVKLDDPSRNPGDAVDVLKLNLVRDFQTGIYDYNTMTSLFVRSADFEPVKVSFVSTEWCGNVYEELALDPGHVSQRILSYFENESASRAVARPRGGLLEEELFVRLRGLNGAFLRPGERRAVPFLAGAFRRRLTHKPLKWGQAVIQRSASTQTVSVPAGRFQADVYSVRVAGGPEGLFYVESRYPHRIVRWEWKHAPTVANQDADDTGELAGSARLEYWKLHNPGDERYLSRLGLRPGPG